MSSGQRIIKYAAIAFAIFLIVNIISAIVFGIGTFFGIFSNVLFPYTSENEVTGEMIDLTNKIVDNHTIKNLEIDSGITKLNIVKGENFKLEVKEEADHISVNQSGSTLKIKAKGHNNWLFKYKEPEMILTIPSDYQFEKVKIKCGVGDTKIDALFGSELILESGIGNIEIHELKFTNETEIQGGVGNVQIHEAKITDLDLKCGVGDIALNAVIEGDSKIKGGIGNASLTLQGNDYLINLNTGIGKMTVNGQSYGNDTIYGKGDNRIKVTGGLGNITISTQE